MSIITFYINVYGDKHIWYTLFYVLLGMLGARKASNGKDENTECTKDGIASKHPNGTEIAIEVTTQERA